ncbi:MAG TPA: alpha/beta fold hydrolase [Gemmatimonadales bacterium]
MARALLTTALLCGGVVPGAAQIFVDRSPHLHGFATVGAVTLHFLDWGGTGPLLLLIPGLGNTAHVYDEFAPHFTDRFHVVGLTLRGHGQSDRPPTGYRTDSLAADVRRFMDLLGARRATLVGHSIGSDVLTYLAARHGERVERLVYLEEAAGVSDIGTLLSSDGQTDLTALAEQPTREAFLKAYWLPLEGADVRTAALEADLHFGQFLGPSGLVQPVVSGPIANAYVRGKLSPERRGVRAPALAVFGRGYVVSLYSGEQHGGAMETELKWKDHQILRFRAEIPHAKVVVLEGAGHPLLIQRGREVVSLVRAYLTVPETERSGRGPRHGTP